MNKRVLLSTTLCGALDRASVFVATRRAKRGSCEDLGGSRTDVVFLKDPLIVHEGWHAATDLAYRCRVSRRRGEFSWHLRGWGSGDL